MYNAFTKEKANLYSLKFFQDKLLKMDTTELKGNCLEQRAKLKQKFSVLTDDDLLYEQGKKEEMLGRVQVKLGKTKEELQKIIEGL